MLHPRVWPRSSDRGHWRPQWQKKIGAALRISPNSTAWKLPLIVGTLLTIVKLLVEVPLLGATNDTVPPPPLSTDPGVSVIAAGAAKGM